MLIRFIVFLLAVLAGMFFFTGGDDSLVLDTVQGQCGSCWVFSGQ